LAYSHYVFIIASCLQAIGSHEQQYPWLTVT